MKIVVPQVRNGKLYIFSILPDRFIILVDCLFSLVNILIFELTSSKLMFYESETKHFNTQLNDCETKVKKEEFNSNLY